MSKLLAKLRREFKPAGDSIRAKGAQAYMKSEMPYHGVPTPAMRKICRAAFCELAFRDSEHWRGEVLAIWTGARYREERYAAVELTGIRQARPFQTPEAMTLYERLIVEGAWWDFVDWIASRRVGPILMAYPAPMKKLMRQWSRSEDIWKRRTSILCQLGAKGETDLKLLYDCIEPSLGEKEFFLRKGIGWALRQYAWTDPTEVIRYVKEKHDALSPLSRREALRNTK
jgi:3-methyladenine DNA glycosylase AlkD